MARQARRGDDPRDDPPRADSPGVLLRRHGLRPKKALGQCFLHDPRVADQIVAAAAAGPDDTVVEIGAGLGVLTGRLAARAGRVVAIERDRELCAVLRAELGGRPNLELCEQDALTFSFARFGEPVLVVGNLPYNISSQLIFHLLAAADRVRTATVMLQKELADRLVSPPGSRVYGAASVLCQQRATVRRCLRVGRGAFVPAPRVDSMVIQLEMHDPARAARETPPRFAEVVHAAFGQRRKTLQRALSARFDSRAVERALAGAGVDGKQRAEVLDVAAFRRLAAALAAEAGE